MGSGGKSEGNRDVPEVQPPVQFPVAPKLKRSFSKLYIFNDTSFFLRETK